MNHFLLSTINPAPLGFTYKPNVLRKDLLSHVFAIYTQSPEDIIALIPTQHDSIKGLIVYPADQCLLEHISPHLWKMGIPSMAEAHLQNIVLPLLTALESLVTAHDQSIDLQRRMNRVNRDLEQAQNRLSPSDSRTRPTSTTPHQSRNQITQ
jgi:hypothetical protein